MSETNGNGNGHVNGGRYAKIKGARNELRSKRLLESAGYAVTKSGGSLGAFDLIGVSATDLVLVQVKTNRPPPPAEREALRLFAVPTNARKLIHVWRDHEHQPLVTLVP